MELAFLRATLTVLFATTAFGQVPSNSAVPNSLVRPTFDVASVKPAIRVTRGAAERTGGGGVGLGCPTSMKVDHGRVEVRCATISMLIGYAFRISPDRVIGPDWMMSPGSPRFDIAAKIPQSMSEALVPEMFQSLLSDRFKLVFHRGSKSGGTYALMLEKGGLKLKEAVLKSETQDPGLPAAPEDSPTMGGFFGSVQTITMINGQSSVTIISNPQMGVVREMGDPFQMQRWEASNISLEGLADLLDKVAPFSSPVVDTTGVKGRFQMVLEVSLRDARPGMVSVTSSPSTGDDQGTELEETVLKAFNDGLRKLGLKLERRKGTVEVLVVDYIDKNPTEN